MDASEKAVGQIFHSLQFSGVECFEDKPVAHGMKSLARRVLWETGTAPFRLLLAAKTGTSGAILSQNFLFVARK